MAELLEFAMGIGDLPPQLGMLRAGGVYGVIGMEETALRSLLWSLSGKAVDTLAKVIYVFDTDPDVALGAATPLADRLRASIDSKRVVALWPRQSALTSGSISQLTKELAYFAPGRRQLIVIEGADRLVGEDASNDAAMESLSHWCAVGGNTLVLAFRQRDGHPDPTPGLQTQARHFSGLGRLARISGDLRWDVFHWFSDGGIVSPSSCVLTTLGDGRLQALAQREVARSAEAFVVAADEHQVIAIANAIEKGHQAPTAWEVVEDILQLERRAADAVAATLIIGFDRDTSQEKISRAVYELRHNRGSRVKIVIRETGARLRYQQEALLCKLGANIVAPAEVNHARFLSLVEMVQGQVFSKQPPESYERAVADAMPLAEQDYLPPAAFIDSVAHSLQRSQALGVQSNLVRIKIVAGLAPIDALRYCIIKRPGDVCTLENDNLWLFLFACREGDVSASLERIFRLPVSDLCEDETRYPSGDALYSALAQLGRVECAPRTKLRLPSRRRLATNGRR